MTQQPAETSSAAPVSTPPGGGPEQGLGRAGRAGLGLLLLLVLLPYAASLEAGFAWLDHREIVEGTLLVDGWSELVGLFWNDRNYAGYHRPIYNLAHTLDRAIWGLDPFGFHLSSLLLHGLNAVLVLLLTRALRLGYGPAFVTAALFGLHPVNTAVAGLVHSKADLLATAAMSGAGLLAWNDWRRRSNALMAASLALFVVGVWSKETALVYPIVCTLAVVWGAGPRSAAPRARVYLAWLWGLTILLIAHRLWIGSAQAAGSGLSLGQRLATFATVYVSYVRKLVLPFDLSVCDTVTTFSALTPSTRLQSLVAFGLVVVLQAGVWLRVPVLRKWIALFNLSLLPVAQIVPILHFRADRFLYLPSLAFIGALVQGVVLGVSRVPAGRVTPAARRGALTVVAVLLASGYGVLTARRVQVLRDDETLFSHEVLRTPDYREGLSVLGRHYQRSGRFEQAEPLLRRALLEYPGRISYLDLEGTILAYSHNLLALRRPVDARALIARAGARVTRADIRSELSYNSAVAAYQLGDHAEALPLLERYREEHPTDAGCLYLLGMSAAEVGDRTLARDALSSYLRFHPDAHDRAQVEEALARLGGE